MARSVSVVIPTYNQEKFLAEAIASVRAQAWPDLEVIVVDDGSTDGTADLLLRLEAEGGLRWFRQENAGAAAARNRGIREARKEWVAFLDADDFWLPGKLAAQFEALRQSPAAGLCYTDVLIRFEDGEERELACRPSARPLLWELLTSNFFATPTALVRRDCFGRVGLFDAELRTGEDWDMWLRLAAHFDSIRVARPLALVRVAPHLLKHSVPTLERCTLRVVDRLFACPHVRRRWPEVAAKRRMVYAWHYSVLAKSYLRQRSWGDFCRLAVRSVRSHPAGLFYVAGYGTAGVI